MPATRRRLVDDLNDDPAQTTVLAGLYQLLNDQVFTPWVTARWDNTTITGRAYLDESGHPYLFAEGVWHIDRGTVACRRPDHLAAAVPTYQHTPFPMPAADISKVINIIEREYRPEKPQLLADATYVSTETLMTITGGRTRISGTTIEIESTFNRWHPLRTQRHGVAPKLVRIALHTQPGAGHG